MEIQVHVIRPSRRNGLEEWPEGMVEGFTGEVGIQRSKGGYKVDAQRVLGLIVGSCCACFRGDLLAQRAESRCGENSGTSSLADKVDEHENWVARRYKERLTRVFAISTRLPS